MCRPAAFVPNGLQHQTAPRFLLAALSLLLRCCLLLAFERESRYSLQQLSLSLLHPTIHHHPVVYILF
jgi:hypothetical protein